jgi:outer membrane lipoprotein-sorting protein
MSVIHKMLFLLMLLTTNAMADQSDQEAVDLLHKSEALMRSDATIAEYQVDIIRPEWQRTMTFRSYDDKRNNRFRMEILSPRKTKGTIFLKVNNTLSMYLPKLERRINISPAMMQDPWMGSDFNNQDLLETNSLIDDYTHHIVSREGKGNTAVITIESTPKPTATVTWKKLLQRVRADGTPLELDYRCVKRASRSMVFDQFKEMDGRVIPTRWTMTPQDAPGKHTVITLTSIDFNAKFSDSVFTPEAKGAKSGP